MESIEALLARRSVRKYKTDPVERDLLEKIVEAGHMAPTARNVQPWEFVVITDVAKRRLLSDICENGKFLADAPACIVVLSKDTKYYLEDGCAATTNMLNAAAALGLGSCWVAGDKKPYAADIVGLLGAPAEMKLVALIAVGLPAETPAPTKRSIDEVVHWEAY